MEQKKEIDQLSDPILDAKVISFLTTKQTKKGGDSHADGG